MSPNVPSTIYLKDYKKADFSISKTELNFDLYEDYALVSCTLDLVKTNKQARELFLHGQELELLHIELDGVAVGEDAFQVTADGLTLGNVPEKFKLFTQCKLYPQNNTSLEGLYRSQTMFCTQCEAEGFRKITYYLDRPDVLSEFTTKISADATAYPVLLSNGNLMESGSGADGRHWVKWHDPFPKPSYLFALVAGSLACVEDSFQTVSGRNVVIKLYVEEKDLNKCEHAIRSLKHAMQWDEQVYGREYDLDIFMIVAVDDFNMGAMENKGLNIFNTSCVLANPATTTDAGFQRVEAVVAHEYFHNWSGNRVTCRDWFQLSLKEGFTVFRDAEFSADMGSRTAKRVADVEFLRSTQFAEDAGPMAHPVRPASFIEISNFYTLTVYEKGAEVVRMIRTLLGPELFRQGSDLYFQRHDGQAVTVEDFVQAMEDVSGRDFSQFMNWYTQAGTPVVSVSTRFDESLETLSLTLTQRCPSTPEAQEQEKKPFVIPVAMGLLGKDGPLPVNLAGPQNSTSSSTHFVLELSQPQQEFIFEGVREEPTVSLMRGFSAPIKLDWVRDIKDLRRIMEHDEDGFARWSASQELALQAINGANYPTNRALTALLECFEQLLNDPTLDPEMVALMLSLPSESYLLEQQDVMDIDGTLTARQSVREVIADKLQSKMLKVYESCKNKLKGRDADVGAQAIGLRSLQNQALKYLMLLDQDIYQTLCLDQYHHGSNMTNSLAAMQALVHSPFKHLEGKKEEVLADFYQRWQGESLVVNAWFSVQASDPSGDALAKVKALLCHDSFDFKNPNKVRSVIGVFAQQNLTHFHSVDGQGYAFLADQILKLDKSNPQIAARLVSPLSKWRRLDETRSNFMRQQLERIKQQESLSNDAYEIVEKSLKE